MEGTHSLESAITLQPKLGDEDVHARMWAVVQMEKWLQILHCIRIMGAQFLMVTERSYERKKIRTNPMVLETTWLKALGFYNM